MIYLLCGYIKNIFNRCYIINLIECSYTKAVQQNDECCLAAKEAINWRYRGTRPGSPWPTDSFDTNVAAIVLVLANDTIIAGVSMAGTQSSTAPIPYCHAEARAFVKAVNKARTVHNGGLEGCTEHPENTGSPTRELFNNWETFLSNIKKVVIYSDRSPCPPCGPFLEKLCTNVDTTIYYSILYKRGVNRGLAKDIEDARAIINTQQNQQKSLLAKFDATKTEQSKPPVEPEKKQEVSTVTEHSPATDEIESRKRGRSRSTSP